MSQGAYKALYLPWGARGRAVPAVPRGSPARTPGPVDAAPLSLARGCRRSPVQSRRAVRVAASEGDGYGVDMADSDWRTFRARMCAMEKSVGLLVTEDEEGTMPGDYDGVDLIGANKMALGDCWAHKISAPEAGSLLVARAGMPDLFQKTVILMINHDDAKGSTGIILNLPSRTRMRDRVSAATIGHWKVFGDNHLFIGGPVQAQLIMTVHSNHELETDEHTVHVLDGIYVGGIDKARELVEEGRASPYDYQLYAGVAQWEPKQLRAEVERGEWHVAACNRKVVEAHKSYSLGSIHDGMWQQVMGLIGEPTGGSGEPSGGTLS